MNALTTRRKRLFATLVTTAVVAISGFMFHFPGAFPPNNGDSFNAGGFLGAVFKGRLTGALVGLSQMFVMRMVEVRSGRWALGTAVALWLIHTVGDVLPDNIGFPVMVFLGGLLLGGLQWWALQWPASHGLPWLAVTAFAWSLGMWLSHQLAAGSDWRAEHIVAGLMTGVLLGLANAGLWLWTLAQHSPGASPGLAPHPTEA